MFREAVHLGLVIMGSKDFLAGPLVSACVRTCGRGPREGRYNIPTPNSMNRPSQDAKAREGETSH